VALRGTTIVRARSAPPHCTRPLSRFADTHEE
jgi:hypothetical protein